MKPRNNIRIVKLLLVIAVVFLSYGHAYEAPLCNNNESGTLSPSFLSNIKKELNPQLLTMFLNNLSSFDKKVSNHIFTFVDFSLPSTFKRLWTINGETGEILFNTYVAHGRNTGDNEPVHFSNKPQSHQSSLGFYLTCNSYIGKHGKSLRLQGLEKGINDKAMERAIVIHGADYVSETFINAHGRLGRSHGCPAIPNDIVNDFIDTVKEGSLLFIYHPSYKQ